MSQASLAAVFVKEEPEWDSGESESAYLTTDLGENARASSSDRFKAAGRDHLTTDSEDRRRPQVLQPSDLVFTEHMCIKVEAEFVKEEPECVKQEPEDGTDSYGESAARAVLYAGHSVKDELVGPECVQPPVAGTPDTPGQSSPVIRVEKDSELKDCAVGLERSDLEGQLSSDNDGNHVASNTTRNRSNKIFQCDLCKKTFTRQHGLTLHKKTHTEAKSYPCSLCERVFNRLNNLNTHEKCHAKQTCFTCEICNKEFTKLRNFTVHMRIHKGVKRHSCGMCEKEFYRTEHLRRHERTHTGEKPYSCGQCDKKFTQASSLKQHEVVHSGEKPYVCELCNKTYARLGSLLLHKRGHSGEKPYECDVCSKRFALKQYLENHKMVHQKEWKKLLHQAKYNKLKE